MSAQSVKIDDLPIGRFHIKIAGLTFGAHFTDGYILGLIGIAFTLLSPQMQLDAFWQGLIGASATSAARLSRPDYISPRWRRISYHLRTFAWCWAKVSANTCPPVPSATK